MYRWKANISTIMIKNIYGKIQWYTTYRSQHIVVFDKLELYDKSMVKLQKMWYRSSMLLVWYLWDEGAATLLNIPTKHSVVWNAYILEI